MSIIETLGYTIKAELAIKNKVHFRLDIIVQAFHRGSPDLIEKWKKEVYEKESERFSDEFCIKDLELD